LTVSENRFHLQHVAQLKHKKKQKQKQSVDCPTTIHPNVFTFIVADNIIIVDVVQVADVFITGIFIVLKFRYTFDELTN